MYALCPALPCLVQPCPALSSLPVCFSPTGLFLFVLFFIINKKPISFCNWVLALFHSPQPWQNESTKRGLSRIMGIFLFPSSVPPLIRWQLNTEGSFLFGKGEPVWRSLPTSSCLWRRDSTSAMQSSRTSLTPALMSLFLPGRWECWGYCLSGSLWGMSTTVERRVDFLLLAFLLLPSQIT